jgi:hypothetical protein
MRVEHWRISSEYVSGSGVGNTGILFYPKRTQNFEAGEAP